MYIIWKDPNMRLYGKRHKRDRYYFRWHYGKQRMVHISCEYVDKPTEKQLSAREAFTALRREVARQLKDEKLKGEWLRRFEADNEGYKMLHTYVYAKLKATPSPSMEGENTEQIQAGQTKERRYMVSLQPGTKAVIVVWDGVIVPIFLASNVPKIALYA